MSLCQRGTSELNWLPHSDPVKCPSAGWKSEVPQWGNRFKLLRFQTSLSDVATDGQQPGQAEEPRALGR